MVDWLDAHFSDGSDSSDEEFIFHEEDAVEDTSNSSEEEYSDVDKNSVTNQNTPQHSYGHHTANGNSAATHRYTSSIQVNGNDHRLDENGYTNGKVGTNRHHSHLYNPYGRISPRRSNGERIDDDELIYDRSGTLFPYSERLPNRPFRELRVPFEIFSDTFNQFHDEQETMLEELKETEHEMLQMNTQLEEEIEVVKEECNDLKSEYRDICEENKQIREYIEEMHSFLIPYLNNIVGANDNDEDNEGVKDMDIDKNNADEDNEEKDEDIDFEFDEVTLGPFLIELFRQQQQQRQQQEEEQEVQGDEQVQQEEEKQEENGNQQERQSERDQ